MTQPKYIIGMDWFPGSELKQVDCPVLAALRWTDENKPVPMAGMKMIELHPRPAYVVISNYMRGMNRWEVAPHATPLDPGFEIIAWQPIVGLREIDKK